MTLLTLAALGWLLASIAMASLWAWQQFPAGNRILLATMAAERGVLTAGRGSYPGSVLLDAGWTALVAGLAILDANAGGGAWARRSAIAWMMGSWGARLVVQRLYAPGGPSCVSDRAGGAQTELLPSFQAFQATAASAFFFSLPALIASVNPDPNLSSLELAAGGLWMIGFAGETTADRQLLRFTSNPANLGRVCRAGLWRYSNNATAVFEAIIWTAYALFAFASPLGLFGFACPAVMVYALATRSVTGPQP